MPTFALLVSTLVCQLFIAGMLTFLLIRQRGINRELKAIKERILPYQVVASFGGTHSGERERKPYQ